MTTYVYGQAPWTGPNWTGLPRPLQPGDIVEGGGQTFTAPFDNMGSGAPGNVITARNFTVTNAGGRGMFINGESYLRFENVHSDGNSSSGVVISPETSATDIAFDACSFNDNGNHGVVWDVISAGDVTSLNNVSFTDCAAERNGQDGLHLFVANGATGSLGMSGLVAQRNSLIDNGLRGARIRNDRLTAPLGTDLLFTDNIVTGNGMTADGGGLTIGGFGLGETGFGQVTIARNTSSLNTGDTGGLNVFYLNYAEIYDNLIEGNLGVAGGFDAAGILVDHGNQNTRVYRNIINDHIYDGDGSQVNVGIAIIVGDTINVDVFSNSGSGNRGAFSFGGTPASNCRVYNNGFTGTLEAGVTLNADRVDNDSVEFRNNVITGTGTSPEAVRKITGSGTWIENYNQFDGFVAFEPNEGSSPGANSTNGVDPLLDANGYTTPASPGYNQGEYVVGFHDQAWALDQNKLAFRAPIDIGLQSNVLAEPQAVVAAEADMDALDITQAQTLETPTVAEIAILRPVGKFQAQTIGTPTVQEVGTTVVLDLSQSQTLGEPPLTQTHELAAQSLTQGQELGGPQVFEDIDLGAMDSLTQAQTLGTPTVQEVAGLNAQDMAQAQTLGLVSISEKQDLAIENIVQAQTLGRPVVSDSTLPRLTPPSRRIKVASMDKLVVGA